MQKVPELNLPKREDQLPESQPGLLKRTSTEIRETYHASLETDEYGDINRVNEYHVIRNLGRGAFAEVKLCRQALDGESQGDLFAIKVFNKSLLKRQRSLARGPGRGMNVNTALNKVQQEIAIMKKLCHPNLVQMFEVIDDPDGDQLFMVLEYVPNGIVMEWDETADAFYSRFTGGVYTEEQAAGHMMDICAGMQYLHQNHICHRDLKPENILLSSQNRCKIADFGVSHYFEQDEQKSPRRDLYRSESRGQLKNTEGTWSFWAPEMCQPGHGNYSGYAADMWSMGVVLWVMLFGKLPFSAETPPELFAAIAAAPHEVPADKHPSEEVKEVLDGLLKKDPRERIGLGDLSNSRWFDIVGVARRNTLIPQVEVSNDEVNKAFSGVNSFVMMTKVEIRLQQRLKKARNSLRGKSPIRKLSSTANRLRKMSHSGAAGSLSPKGNGSPKQRGFTQNEEEEGPRRAAAPRQLSDDLAPLPLPDPASMSGTGRTLRGGGGGGGSGGRGASPARPEASRTQRNSIPEDREKSKTREKSRTTDARAEREKSRLKATFSTRKVSQYLARSRRTSTDGGEDKKCSIS